MKKLLLIILIVCFVVGISMPVLAKAKFGNWDKWDKQLPPWDNEDWVYSEESFKVIGIPLVAGTQFWFREEGQEQWRSIKVKNQPVATNVLFLLTCLVFKDNDQRAPITIFSPAPINGEVKGIEDALATAEIAIAAFPSSKGRVIIRSYEKKDGLLQFFKKWTIVCENGAIIPEKYDDWFINQSKKLTKENIEILPQLVVFKTEEKKSFFIGVSLPLLKEFLINEKLPWIKKTTIVVF